MSIFDRIAEERIARAIEAGELSGLPGEGQPLELDDDALVPPSQRAAMRVLKNSGYVPEEVRQLKALREMEQALRRLPPGAQEAEALTQRLLGVRLALERAGLSVGNQADWARYAGPLGRALATGKPDHDAQNDDGSTPGPRCP